MATTDADPWFQTLFADRMGGANYGKGTEIYKFEKIKRAKRAALAAYPDRQLLDFGIGENDDMAPAQVREALKREVDRLENRGYADNGIQAYKDAVAEFMQREFQVSLNPTTEIVHAIGSKPAYAMMPAVFVNPGDVTLMTVPGYPVAGTHTRYYGGEVHRLPLLAENGFFPDLKGIPADIRKRAKLLVLNYPNSPTGKVATRDFYKQAIEFAHENQVIIVQDAAHIMLSYDDQPLSFLQVDGAKDVGVEVHSMSKGFNMIGWRLGWVCGHAKIVQAFADVKDNSDSGQFMAIQHAAAAALRDPQIPLQVRAKYKRRLAKLVAALKQVGFEASMPGGTYFLYVKSPVAAGDRSFANAEAASQFLITEQSVCCVPWDDAGPFLRFSVTYMAATEAEEDALMAETVSRLGKLQLRFA
ncbi:LL-diaminopimelate aminotransferase [Tuwongella immobilis]|uniref:Aminotransferase n=1 Tax=Tuwongella immobilis TaxID=692036 RepID=A0A6C2YLE7_9BACT|nr:LL-diaminopimelate aminotransferase [Tuwongella immobilis]VIP01925.1 aspartate aminotransferase : Aspartate aminotransferase OS=Blastopirellula marina DSM 3645 GN=DSM3645_10287 PE=4 SV=1: Aminotran_1_2 [Tuwongella immobilis]VTR99863.1 aspartate aminotransferase : Aspartate aminotransferase OS=Blastopirellula marina DSM 3645 GN=DSM3645_10287 PE=4 SV=1: Aminotran_1_2 [Tuwongella immobilis]